MSPFQLTAAVLIFAATYLILAFQKIPRLHLDRPSGALAGAVLMVACGVLSFEQAWRAIDARTIVLLLGMMVLNVFLEECGFFELCAKRVLAWAGSPVQLLVGLALLSGALSALFVNDTICLMLTPPLLVVLRRSSLPYLPYLITLAMAANVGSVMTLTGNPQNMLIGVYSGWSYGRFLLAMLPLGLLALAVLVVLVWLFYRRTLAEAAKAEAFTKRADQAAETARVDRKLLVKSLLVLACVLVGFVAWGDLAMTAMLGAVALLCFSGRSPGVILRRVDWVLLAFFAGLFIVVEGLEQTGLVARASDELSALYGESLATQIPVFAAVTVVASNIVSNVPYVVLVRDLVPTLADPPRMWLVLAMASTFAGNLTIPGSVATLIVLEAAKEHGQVSFWEFFRVGLPVTLLTVLLGALWLAAF
jgi:Na+/H+ antiporter NhaD/arsenite permease-like protein